MNGDQLSALARDRDLNTVVLNRWRTALGEGPRQAGTVLDVVRQIRRPAERKDRIGRLRQTVRRTRAERRAAVRRPQAIDLAEISRRGQGFTGRCWRPRSTRRIRTPPDINRSPSPSPARIRRPTFRGRSPSRCSAASSATRADCCRRSSTSSAPPRQVAPPRAMVLTIRRTRSTLMYSCAATRAITGRPCPRTIPGSVYPGRDRKPFVKGSGRGRVGRGDRRPEEPAHRPRDGQSRLVAPFRGRPSSARPPTRRPQRTRRRTRNLLRLSRGRVRRTRLEPEEVAPRDHVVGDVATVVRRDAGDVGPRPGQQTARPPRPSPPRLGGAPRWLIVRLGRGWTRRCSAGPRIYSLTPGRAGGASTASSTGRTCRARSGHSTSPAPTRTRRSASRRPCRNRRYF